MSEPTVRDIAWRVNPEFSACVYAEDQFLFVAREYVAQVVQEHNSFQALRKALAALVALGWPQDEVNAPACCNYSLTPDARHYLHEDDCPWLVAKQLLEEKA